MENAFFKILTDILFAIRWQVVMFFVAGIAFELFCEFIKASLYPKNKGKDVPRLLGLILGFSISVVYTTLAFMAYAKFGDNGWFIPGGAIFAIVWLILFFFYQYKAITVAKVLRDWMFPTLKDPDYVKTHKEKVEKAKKVEVTPEMLAELMESLKK